MQILKIINVKEKRIEDKYITWYIGEKDLEEIAKYSIYCIYTIIIT